MQLSVRDVSKQVFNEFKSRAVQEELTLGKALTIAMKHWLDKEKEKKSFFNLKPVDWGKGTEKASRQIDEALYT